MLFWQMPIFTGKHHWHMQYILTKILLALIAVRLSSSMAHNYKGKGHATEAMRAILDHFMKKGAKAVRMQVNKENAIAIHVYQKCGFEEDGTVPWNEEFLFMRKKW